MALSDEILDLLSHFSTFVPFVRGPGFTSDSVQSVSLPLVMLYFAGYPRVRLLSSTKFGWDTGLHKIMDAFFDELTVFIY